MQTILGPLRGVLRITEPQLEVRHINGAWRVIWTQSIREENGWDEITAPCGFEMREFATRQEAQAALTVLERGRLSNNLRRGAS